jgi:hypothetical protein
MQIIACEPKTAIAAKASKSTAFDISFNYISQAIEKFLVCNKFSSTIPPI